MGDSNIARLEAALGKYKGEAREHYLKGVALHKQEKLDDAVAEYDPRFLAGISFFNRRQYFEAHEVWEDLWHECSPECRRFYQGLIQAAVALHHWRNGNWRGRKWRSAWRTRSRIL